jgi:hypothetical protein
MDELENLIARRHGLVTVHVLFYRPRNAPADWVKTDLWRRAAAMPDVRVHADENGVQAELFGATTSGHVVLYQQDGRLRFSGGITNTRGHAGENAGADALAALLTGGTPQRTETPVYGCPLAGPRFSDNDGGDQCPN